jgi:hypothetical protein
MIALLATALIVTIAVTLALIGMATTRAVRAEVSLCGAALILAMLVSLAVVGQ